MNETLSLKLEELLGNVARCCSSVVSKGDTGGLCNVSNGTSTVSREGIQDLVVDCVHGLETARLIRSLGFGRRNDWLSICEIESAQLWANQVSGFDFSSDRFLCAPHYTGFLLGIHAPRKPC
jgi:hypothetical protein